MIDTQSSTLSAPPDNKIINNIILDLDNTLLCAEGISEFPFDDPGMNKKAAKFAIHNMDGYYIIFERPDLQIFLDYIFENFNVSVWTAASKDYALFIVKYILLKDNPDRKLDFILFSEQCDYSKSRYDSHKKLDIIYNTVRLQGYNPSNTIIIDDHDDVYKSQPNQAIHIKAFEILDKGSENDSELLKIMEYLREHQPRRI